MLWLLAAQAIAALVGIFAFSLVGRRLEVSELGRYGFATSSTVAFGLLAEFGVRYVGIRDIALSPERTRQIYRHGALLRWGLAGVSLALLLFVAAIGPWRNEIVLLLLAGMVAVTQFSSDPATWVFFGRGRVDIGACLLIADRLLYLGAINGAAYVFQRAEGLIAATLGANLLRMTLSALWVRGQLVSQEPVHWDWHLLRQLVTRGASIGVAILVFVTYSSLTPVLMRAFSTSQELGYYAVAFGIVSIVLVIPNSLSMALFPMFAHRFTEGQSARSQLHEQVSRLNLLVVLPLAVGLLLFPQQVVTLWVGIRYEPSAIILRVLAVAMTASTLSFMYRLFFFALDRPVRETATSLLGVALAVVMGVPLCRWYGGLGAAITYLVAEFIVAMAKMFASKEWMGTPPYGFVFLRGLVASTGPAPMLLVPGLPLTFRALAYAVGVLGLMSLLKLLPDGIWRFMMATVAGQATRVVRR